MDLEKIKEMIVAMEDSSLSKISIKDGSGFEIELERAQYGAPVQMQHVPAPHAVHHAAPQPQTAPESGAPIAKDVPCNSIDSPMVGTFYSSPSPDDPTFVKVGDTVEEDTVVCIIEAMKVMNEVKAGKSGVIKEICNPNSSPVEFGTKLFTLE